MNVDNTKSQMRKGMLEYCIMLLLHRQPSYANDIIAQLKALAEKDSAGEGDGKPRPEDRTTPLRRDRKDEDRRLLAAHGGVGL